MKISLLDPGLQDKTGHHFEWTRRLAQEARCRGLEVVIGCSRYGASAAVNELRALADVHAVFGLPPFQRTDFPASFRPTAASRIGRQRSYARIIAREIQCLPRSDLWLFPSLHLEQAAACSLLDRPPAIFGCIHAPPDINGPQGPAGWRWAFESIDRCRLRYRIGTTTPALQQAYAPLASSAIEVWPLVHDGRQAVAARPALGTVGILGNQSRLEKGADGMPTLVDRILGMGLQVLMHDSGAKVRPITRPGLTWVSGFVADFVELVRQCDLIVVPYDPAKYRVIGSGVVWEALACGVPVLAPADCYPGDLVRQTGAGICFAERGDDVIALALRDAIVNYPQLAAAAHSCSRHWQEEHGVARFLDRALSLSP